MSKSANKTKIGGQAVIEGVMMRGNGVMATAVRDPSNTIQIESSRFVPLSKRSFLCRLPILRGVISFAVSMFTGMKTLNRASEVFGDLTNTEPSRFEKWLSEKTKIDLMSIVTFIGVVLGVVLAVGLFILLPNWITDGIYSVVNLDTIKSEIGKTIVRNLTSGIIRIIIFVLYIWLCSAMKDIRRLFSYHGAEHKTISCYEHGLPLTVENARSMKKVHDRCGTTFMVLVMVISIIFFSFFGWQELWLRILIRIAGIPIVAGISYEVLMLFAKFDNPLARILKAPGLLLQKLTTREPDDSMLEVAIAAFETVLKMEADSEFPISHFVTNVNIKIVDDKLKKILGNLYADESRHILMSIAKAKTSGELRDKRITNEQAERAIAVAKERAMGKPLQYALGETCFYGNTIKTDNRALIPRAETELLTEQAIISISKNENASVLDLCTGSGAIAITIAKQANCSVIGSDISNAALSLAKENAALNEANVTFIESDMFSNIDGRFDVIVSNPPYIPTQDILNIDASVRDFEPHIALDGGMDGLDFYRKISNEYKQYLKADGILMLEVGVGQCDDVIAIFGESANIVSDYNTPPINRVLVFKPNNEIGEVNSDI
jgi:release factor-specific protein-(glutamine-N5) methyltransferase